jgi:hypothetical protein
VLETGGSASTDGVLVAGSDVALAADDARILEAIIDD